MTGPPRRRTPVTRSADIDQDTRLGSVYVGSLLRAQLSLALRVLAGLAATIGTLPLVFHLAPGLAGVEILGAPLPWLVVGVVPYPVLLALGWVYLRSAERNEQNFADIVEHRDEHRDEHRLDRPPDRPEGDRP